MPDTWYRTSRYRTFLLRLWQERPALRGRPAVWRFSLEDIHTGERRGFASLEVLMAFLQDQMTDDEPAADSDPSPF